MKIKILRLILILLIIFGLFSVVFNSSPDPDKKYESTCYIKESNPEQYVRFHYFVYRNGNLYLLRGDKRDGCLILRDHYFSDFDRDGLVDRGIRYGYFVFDNFDHCCVTGD